MPVITLTTDFGTKDWFVGTMKGVVLGIQPRASVVDITHEVPPGDIRAGAFVLAVSFRYFPKGTVHVVVVDPGVGSTRRAIAVRTKDYFFVGPDNGVLSLALAREQVKEIRLLENARYFLQPVSRTFHGRDVFAPVGAHVSQGLDVRRLGPRLKEFVRLDWPQPAAKGRGVQGETVYIDRFGNAISNIDARVVESLGRGPLEVWLQRKRLCAVSEFYQSVPHGRAVAVVGSSGLLEIAINGGSAQKTLGLKVGTALSVRPRSRGV